MTERLQGLDSKNDTTNIVVYSSLVRVLKIFLPLAAIAIIGVLLIWPQLAAIQSVPLNKADIQALKQAETENRLLNPVFNTNDESGRPIIITATEAIQRRSDENSIELIAPSATLKDTDRSTTLNADNGHYDQLNKIIELHNNVIVRDTANNILETEQLTADIGNNSAHNDVPTTLTTPNGVITGQGGVIIENNGAKTTFKGPAKAVIK
ncbi:MAG: LPS export ABC transporter periplasmic protein LptC [Alphaproteobacteria bacterium]|nr:MAG: LPS export ABC transporter periplasmic protein LptC [Alphaproteobacteria bacterium]